MPYASSKDLITAIPSDVDAAIVFQNADVIRGELESMVSTLSKSENFKYVCIPWLFEDQSEFDAFVDGLEDAIDESKHVEAIVLILKGENFAVAIKISDAGVHFGKKLQSLTPLVGQLYKKISPLFPNKDLSIVRDTQSESLLVFGTSGQLAKQLSDRISATVSGNPPEDALVRERHFQRGIASFRDELSTADAIFYFNPFYIAKVLAPYLGEQVTKKKLTAYGIQNVVSCTGTLNYRQTASRSDIELAIHLPYAFPRTGIAELWHTGKPIESVPAIFDLPNLSTYYFKIEDVDVVEFETIKRRLHEKAEGKDKYLNAMESEYQKVGGYEVARDRTSGYQMTIRYWRAFEDGRWGNSLVRLARHSNVESAERYAAAWCKNYSKEFPLSRQTVGGNTCWFRTEEVLNKWYQYNMNRPVKDDYDRYSNLGWVVTNIGWSLNGFKLDCEDLLPLLEDTVSLSERLEEFFPGTRCLNRSTFAPSWIELNSFDLRVAYINTDISKYLQKKFPRKGIGMYEKAIRERGAAVFDHEDDEDRLILFKYIVHRYVLERWYHDLSTFQCDESSALFNWIATTKRQDGLNENN